MKNIAVGVDFSNATDAVLERATELARITGAKVHLVHIFAPEPAFVGYAVYTYPGVDARAEELSTEKEKLRNLVDQLEHEGIDTMAYMKEEQTVKGLIDFAEHREADLLVIGTHGHNVVERILLGSVAEGVVRKTSLPVLVVPVRDKES
ncbi:MAG: universal stress protein [Verrucomicrobiota bacterium]